MNLYSSQLSSGLFLLRFLTAILFLTTINYIQGVSAGHRKLFITEFDMDATEYLAMMRGRLTAAFDFKDAPSELVPAPSVWAVHNRSSEKYFLSKSISLYTVNNDEYVGLYDCRNPLSPTDIKTVLDQFKRLVTTLPTDEKHMSSIFTAAFISEKEISQEVIGAVAGIKFHKDFWFTLRGWADLAVILVDLTNGNIYSNGFGKRMMRNFALPSQ